MEVNIKFDLSQNNENYHYDKKELNSMLKHTDMSIVIWDTEQLFRNTLKYNEKLTEDQYDIIEKLQTEFLSIIEEHHVREVLED